MVDAEGAALLHRGHLPDPRALQRHAMGERRLRRAIRLGRAELFPRHDRRPLEPPRALVPRARVANLQGVPLPAALQREGQAHGAQYHEPQRRRERRRVAAVLRRRDGLQRSHRERLHGRHRAAPTRTCRPRASRRRRAASRSFVHKRPTCARASKRADIGARRSRAGARRRRRGSNARLAPDGSPSATPRWPSIRSPRRAS